MVMCPDCKGTNKCQACDGTGCRSNPPHLVGKCHGCLLCGGDGENKAGTGICAKCDGTGAVTPASLGLPSA